VGSAVGSGGDENPVAWGTDTSRVGTRPRAGGEPGGRRTGPTAGGGQPQVRWGTKSSGVGSVTQSGGDPRAEPPSDPNTAQVWRASPVQQGGPWWGALQSSVGSGTYRAMPEDSAATASVGTGGESETAGWIVAVLHSERWIGAQGAQSAGVALLAVLHSERWIGAQGAQSAGVAMSVWSIPRRVGVVAAGQGKRTYDGLWCFEVPGLVEASSRGSPEGCIPKSMPGRVSNTQLNTPSCHRRFHARSRGVATRHLPA